MNKEPILITDKITDEELQVLGREAAADLGCLEMEKLRIQIGATSILHEITRRALKNIKEPEK